MWKTGGEVRKYEMSDRHDDSSYFMVDILKTDLSIQGGKSPLKLDLYTAPSVRETKESS